MERGSVEAIEAVEVGRAARQDGKLIAILQGFQDPGCYSAYTARGPQDFLNQKDSFLQS
jgi:hypothetical protein